MHDAGVGPLPVILSLWDHHRAVVFKQTNAKTNEACLHSEVKLQIR